MGGGGRGFCDDSKALVIKRVTESPRDDWGWGGSKKGKNCVMSFIDDLKVSKNMVY